MELGKVVVGTRQMNRYLKNCIIQAHYSSERKSLLRCGYDYHNLETTTSNKRSSNPTDDCDRHADDTSDIHNVPTSSKIVTANCGLFSSPDTNRDDMTRVRKVPFVLSTSIPNSTGTGGRPLHHANRPAGYHAHARVGRHV